MPDKVSGMALRDVEGRRLRSERFASAVSLRWLVVTSTLEGLADSTARTLLSIIAVMTLGAGTGLVGVINALGLTAFLLLGLPIGIIADRIDAPGRIMTRSTLARAGVAVGVLACWGGGWLHGATGITTLVSAALIIGIADVFYTTGQSLLVPKLTAPDHIREAFGRVHAGTQAGAVVGPPLLSGLLLIAAAPTAWIAPAAAYLLSSLTQRQIHRAFDVPAPSTTERISLWVQGRAGISHLMAHPILRRMTAANMLNNAGVMAANTVVPVVALRHLDVSPPTFTALAAAGAVAGVLVATVASRITAALGLATVRVLAAVAASLGILGLALGGAILDVLPGSAEVWLGVQFVLAGASAAVANVAGSDLVPRLAPPGKLGSVIAAQRTITLGIMPLSALLTGLIGTSMGITPAIALWATLILASAVPCFRIPDLDPR